MAFDMGLLDIAPKEEWIKLETEIYKRSGLCASIFDTEGNRITDNHIFVNHLCPVVKESDKGQQFICSLAHMNVANQAMQTRKPVIDECDAGLVKLAVPIFISEQFIGVAGACGLVPEEGEVDPFLVSRTIDKYETEIESLAENIGTITEEQLDSLVNYITEQITLMKFRNEPQN